MEASVTIVNLHYVAYLYFNKETFGFYTFKAAASIHLNMYIQTYIYMKYSKCTVYVYACVYMYMYIFIYKNIYISILTHAYVGICSTYLLVSLSPTKFFCL
jgi:hypothetical protein